MNTLIEARTLHTGGPLKIIVEMHDDDSSPDVDFDNEAENRAYRERWDNGDFRYVGMVVDVVLHDAVIGKADFWGIEHGMVAEGTDADAWEMTPAQYPEPNTIIMGSPLTGTIVAALDNAWDWLIKIDAAPSVRNLIKVAQQWADPNQKPTA